VGALARRLLKVTRMSRIALAVLLLAACGGDDDGGGGGDAGGGADGAPEVDGGGDLAPPPADGQFVAMEMGWGETGTAYTQVFGSILDPRPAFHHLDMEAGACRSYVYEPVDCSPCNGICDSDGECVPLPTSLSAGTVTVSAPAADVVMPYHEYGYYADAPPPEDLFAAGDPVSLDADGGEVAAFSLDTEGVSPISIDLVAGGDTGDDTLELTDGADLELTWSDPQPGSRVNLQLKSNNGAHGTPVFEYIECEADDTGSLVVPRAMIEGFPEKPYQNICAGTDCPPSLLTRFHRVRTDVGERTMELVVGFQRQFIVVHE
jgi:hypothetical protein